MNVTKPYSCLTKYILTKTIFFYLMGITQIEFLEKNLISPFLT